MESGCGSLEQIGAIEKGCKEVGTGIIRALLLYMNIVLMSLLLLLWFQLNGAGEKWQLLKHSPSRPHFERVLQWVQQDNEGQDEAGHDGEQQGRKEQDRVEKNKERQGKEGQGRTG